MTILDSDIDRARVEAAPAGAVTARLLVLAQEIDRLLKHDRELAASGDVGGGGEDLFAGADLEEILRTFAEDTGDAGIDEKLVAALLERGVNQRALLDVRAEREHLIARQVGLSDAQARYAELSARWIAMNSQGDPALGCSLTRLEKEEKELLARKVRMEEADASAGEAEHALECLRVILHDTVDWVPGEAPNEPDTAILRIERIQPADPWIPAAQVALARTKRAMDDVGSLEAGEFQADLLSGFADLLLEGLVRDMAERDGIDRALRPVTRTLTSVRALRGFLSRSYADVVRTLGEVRAKRAQLLARGAR